jgi:hypothetical protein
MYIVCVLAWNIKKCNIFWNNLERIKVGGRQIKLTELINKITFKQYILPGIVILGYANLLSG